MIFLYYKHLANSGVSYSIMVFINNAHTIAYTVFAFTTLRVVISHLTFTCVEFYILSTFPRFY